MTQEGYDYCKSRTFRPEYYSGLNWRDAEKLIGKVVEFSVSGDGWNRGNLNKIITRDLEPHRYQKFSGSCYPYIRTTPETFKHPTIIIGGVELPRPEVEAPKMGTEFYFVSQSNRVSTDTWDKTGYEHRLLNASKIHLTESRAQAWADWWENTVVKAVHCD